MSIRRSARECGKAAFAAIFAFFAIGVALASTAAHAWMESWSAIQDPRGENLFQKITGEKAVGAQTRWDSHFNQSYYVYGKDPASVLKEFIHISKPGRALDIAMGEGRNAVFLARKGFVVDGVDISQVAIRKARNLARERRVSINPIHADLNHFTIPQEKYDLIINIQYLQRNLITQIKKGLRKGGILIYENSTLDQLKNKAEAQVRTEAGGIPKTEEGPPQRDELLAKGELRDLFKDFEIIVYRETNDGKKALASLVARKR